MNRIKIIDENRPDDILSIDADNENHLLNKGLIVFNYNTGLYHMKYGVTAETIHSELQPQPSRFSPNDIFTIV
jgi:hypothetical protein